MISGNRTTVYIYPESRDIDAVSRTIAAGGSLSQNGLYWNNMCLKEIGTPKFWPKESVAHHDIESEYRAFEMPFGCSGRITN